MKRLLTLVLTVVLANFAMAQTSGPADIEKKAKAHCGKMAQQLNLTKEQENKLLPITIEAMTERQNIQARKDTEENKRTAITELRRKTETKMQAVLTAEQFAKWQQIRQQRAMKNGNK